jgi:hypothetical protein
MEKKKEKRKVKRDLNSIIIIYLYIIMSDCNVKYIYKSTIFFSIDIQLVSQTLVKYSL